MFRLSATRRRNMALPQFAAVVAKLAEPCARLVLSSVMLKNCQPPTVDARDGYCLC